MLEIIDADTANMVLLIVLMVAMPARFIAFGIQHRISRRAAPAPGD